MTGSYITRVFVEYPKFINFDREKKYSEDGFLEMNKNFQKNLDKIIRKRYFFPCGINSLIFPNAC